MIHTASSVSAGNTSIFSSPAAAAIKNDIFLINTEQTVFVSVGGCSLEYQREKPTVNCHALNRGYTLASGIT